MSSAHDVVVGIDARPFVEEHLDDEDVVKLCCNVKDGIAILQVRGGAEGIAADRNRLLERGKKNVGRIDLREEVWVRRLCGRSERVGGTGKDDPSPPPTSATGGGTE